LIVEDNNKTNETDEDNEFQYKIRRPSFKIDSTKSITTNTRYRDLRKVWIDKSNFVKSRSSFQTVEFINSTTDVQFNENVCDPNYFSYCETLPQNRYIQVMKEPSHVKR